MGLEISNQEAREGKINQEKIKAREKYKSLIDLVNQRYRSPESTMAGNENMIRSFEAHNSEVLDSVIELGIDEDLENGDLAALEIAAILHDLAKGDSPPENLEGIKCKNR